MTLMKTLKTVVVVGVLAVVVIGALALVMAGRGWWNSGTETATPTTVTVTAEPDTETETETEEPEDTEETEVTEKTEEPEVTETETEEPETDLGLKRDKETVADLSGQERTAVRGVLRDCMDTIGAIHYVSQIKKCLAGDVTEWSEDSARRSGETAY